MLDFLGKKAYICINFSTKGQFSDVDWTQTFITKSIKMSDFAIFQTGGKQYRVTVGDVVKVEKINAADRVEFDQVLMVGDKVGAPFVDGARVVADILEQKRNDKILVFKKKRRQNYRRTRGHRQHVTVLKITEIKG